MKAVIWTDVLQFCTVLSGIIFIVAIAVRQVPGGLYAVWSVASEAGKLHLVNPSTDPAQVTSVWACLIGGAVLSLAPLTTDQAILQRLFTTKSTADCRRAVILQSILIVPITAMEYLAGIALFAFYKFHPDRLRQLLNADAILPFFAVRELPAGLSGLVIAAILAASMAVMSAGINSLTTATVVDYYQRLYRPHAKPEQLAKAGRIGTVCWGVIVTGLALLTGRIGDLMVAYSKVSSFISGPMLGVFLLGVTTRRATSLGTVLGAVLGAAAVAAVNFWTGWSFFYQGAVGVLGTVVCGYAISLLTAAPGEQRIRGLVMGVGQAGETHATHGHAA